VIKVANNVVVKYQNPSCFCNLVNQILKLDVLVFFKRISDLEFIIKESELN